MADQSQPGSTNQSHTQNRPKARFALVGEQANAEVELAQLPPERVGAEAEVTRPPWALVRSVVQCLGPSASATTATSPPPSAATGDMTRTQFEQEMSQQFGVQRIYTGTFDEQVACLNRLGLPGHLLRQSEWRTWDPGSSSPVCRWIVSSFTDFANRIGGLPFVREIGFYDTDYQLDGTEGLVASRDVAADFSSGQLLIYRAASSPSTRRPLPIGRSTATGTYPLAGAHVVGVRGQSPGAPLALPTEEQDVSRIITHELGHGLVEAALTPQAGGPPADPK